MVEGGGSVTRGPGGFGGLFLPFAAIAILIYVADQATKLLIVTNLRPYESIPDSGLLRLTYVTNSGSAFGLLQGQTMFLILISIIGVMGVLFYYRANGRESALLRYSLALLLGGALGNLTDRLIRGGGRRFYQRAVVERLVLSDVQRGRLRPERRAFCLVDLRPSTSGEREEG